MAGKFEVTKTAPTSTASDSKPETEKSSPPARHTKPSRPPRKVARLYNEPPTAQPSAKPTSSQAARPATAPAPAPLASGKSPASRVLDWIRLRDHRRKMRKGEDGRRGAGPRAES